MNVLLILYSEFRTFDTSIKTYNIFNHVDVDVIVHTQTTSQFLYDSTPKIIVKENITNILPNAIVYFENRDEFKKLNTPNHKSPTKHSFFVINDIINSLNKEYDLIFVNRMDSTLFINNVDSFLKNFDKDKIYLNQDIVKGFDKSKWFVPDHFFAGSHESIKYFFNNFTDNIDSHPGVAVYLDSLPFKTGVWEDDLYSIHIRPNMVDFINSNIESFHTINEIEFNKKFFNWMYVDQEHKKLEAEWKGYQI